MNILFVASDNAKTSGAFLCMVKLCELLKNEYNCNVIVVLPGVGDGQTLLNEIGVKSFVVKSCTWAVPNEWGKYRKIRFGIKMWIYNFPAQRKIRKIIRRENIEIVHINTSWSYVGAIAALKEEVKLVWHLREALEESQNRSIICKHRGYKLIKQSDRVITVSDFIYRKYKNIIGRKLIKIYEGLDEKNFYRKRKILCGSTINVLCIGLIVEKKGQWQIIEACKCLKNQGYEDIKVNIVGRGCDRYIKQLEERISEYGLGTMISLCGSTSDPDTYYKNTDIMIMTSTSEGFGRTTVEAMMEGCLVIGANSGATPDLLDYGKAGIVYEYGRTEELAEKIEWILKNKENARNIAKKGQNFALKNFTAKKNAEKVYEEYKKLMI